MRIFSRIQALVIAALLLFPSAAMCVSEDGYEPDNVALKATAIATDGTWQSHTIYPAADDDWVRFNAESGKVYLIETGGILDGCDTFIYLFDTDRVSKLEQDDDSGSEADASLIEFRCLESGEYFVYVKHFRESGTGTYSISVREEGAATLPDPYEPDDTYKNATPVEVDVAQRHSLSPEDTSDWYWFEAWEGWRYAVVTTDSYGNYCTYTHLYLYEFDGSTPVIDGPGTAALIWTSEKSNRYYVEVVGDGTTEDIYYINVVIDPESEPEEPGRTSAGGCFIRSLSE